MLIKKHLKILGILLVVILITACGKTEDKNPKPTNEEAKLEAAMKSIASKFYDEKIRAKVIGMDNQIIYLKDIEENGYDISKIIDPKDGTTCDKEKSYAVVKAENPSEIDYDKIKYTVENHLVCANYSSP